MTTSSANPIVGQEPSLTDAQRDSCLEALHRDGYFILPCKASADMLARANAYIDGFCSDASRYMAENALQETNIVELDPVFREFLTFKPVLQMCYDCFGPMFHLGQDKWTRKYRKQDLPPGLEDDRAAIPWHSDGPIGFPEIDGHVPFHTLRCGFLLSDTFHERSGTVELMRASHIHMRCAFAQEELRFRPVTINEAIQTKGYLTEGDQDSDPAKYSENHDVIQAEAGTIFGFQSGCWHRGLPNDSPHPRTIVYFQYSPSMIHPLHRDTPNPSDLSGYTEEERWLLHEPKTATGTVYGTAADKMRMDRFRRSDACADADCYERRLKEEAGQ